MRHLFVVGSLDKQIQNEKELIRLASAEVGGLFCICVGSINLNLNFDSPPVNVDLWLVGGRGFPAWSGVLLLKDLQKFSLLFSFFVLKPPFN